MDNMETPVIRVNYPHPFPITIKPSQAQINAMARAVLDAMRREREAAATSNREKHETD